MLIAGHVGWTVGSFSLLGGRNALVQTRTLLVVCATALLPDILDRSIGLFVPEYGTHGLFHSLLLYAALTPIALFLCRRAVPFLLVMALNVLFDFTNMDLRCFLYPWYGWVGTPPAPRAELPFHDLLSPWSQSVAYALPGDHYVAFELAGLALIAWIVLHNHVIRRRAEQRCRQMTDTQPFAENDRAFPGGAAVRANPYI
jgi:hypothetical protein